MSAEKKRDPATPVSLLGPQRLHRIHFRCTTGGDEGGRGGHDAARAAIPHVSDRATRVAWVTCRRESVVYLFCTCSQAFERFERLNRFDLRVTY